MSGIVKVLGIAVAAVIALLVVVTVVVSLVFDPNDYKDEIAVAVEDATGRELTLEGDLELELFPRLRIAIGAAELSNAEGFGEAEETKETDNVSHRCHEYCGCDGRVGTDFLQAQWDQNAGKPR